MQPSTNSKDRSQGIVPSDSPDKGDFMFCGGVLKAVTTEGCVHIRPLCTSRDLVLALHELVDSTVFTQGYIQLPHVIRGPFINPLWPPAALSAAIGNQADNEGQSGLTTTVPTADGIFHRGATGSSSGYVVMPAGNGKIVVSAGTNAIISSTMKSVQSSIAAPTDTAAVVMAKGSTSIASAMRLAAGLPLPLATEPISETQSNSNVNAVAAAFIDGFFRYKYTLNSEGEWYFMR
jgi:hypothetical protein